MSVIIITGDGLEHKYVRKCLIGSLKDHVAGILIEKPLPRRMSFSILRNLHRRYSFIRIIERSVTKLCRIFLRHSARKEVALRSVIGEIKETCTTAHTLYTRSVNSAESAAWIKDLRPDLIFVYGTGIVSDKILSLASKTSLNLHTGISPFYRGSDTYFWPLYHKEALMIGSTVHECTANVDGGAIYARISVRLQPNDNPFLAFARCVHSGAIVYAQVAKCLVAGGHIKKQHQDFSIGREYRFLDRTFVQDLKMEYLIKSGKLRRIIGFSMSQKLPYWHSEELC